MSDLDDQAYYSLVKHKDSVGDFYFLRRQSVDVMRYLPRFLAKDPEFLKVQNALSWEHENLRLKLIDVSRQFYIETATWGLSSWERIYKVTPPLGASYELRRAFVKAKMLGMGVMTVQAIKHLVNPFLFRPDADIDELPSPGTFRVIIPSGTDHMREIRQTLAEMSPAHLVYNFRFAIHDLYDDESVNLEDRLAAKILTGYEDAYPYDPFSWLRDGSVLHGGIFHRDGGSERFGDRLHDSLDGQNWARASRSGLDMDEYSLAADLLFRDDASKEFLPRCGGESRDGKIRHGENPLPRDLSAGLSITKSLSDAADIADTGGKMTTLCSTYRQGITRRDGRAGRGILEYEEGLDGGISIPRFARSGNYARDGDIARLHDALAVAI